MTTIISCKSDAKKGKHRTQRGQTFCMCTGRKNSSTGTVHVPFYSFIRGYMIEDIGN